MAGSITVLPARRTGFSDFVDALKPGLEQAFNIYMQKQLQEQQKQKVYEELGIGKQQLTPQGQGYAAGQLKTIEQGAPIQATMPQIPQKYYKTVLDIEKMKQLPAGMKVPLGYGAEYDVPSTTPTIGVYTATPEGGVSKTGEVPRGARVLTPSQLETPEQKQQREIETAQEKGKLLTSDIKNLAKQAEMQLMNINALEQEAQSLPGGYEGITARATAIATRGQVNGNVYMYERKIPAIAAGLYRALTGDNRLSDMDAQQRALPLLWNTSIDTSLRKPMFDFLKTAFKTRQKMLEQGFYNIDPDTKQPIVDWQSLLSETKSQQPQGNKIGRFTVEVE